MTTRYLIYVWGDVDPELLGPYPSDRARDKAALLLDKEEGDERGGIYMLDVYDGGAATVGSYCGGFFEDGLVDDDYGPDGNVVLPTDRLNPAEHFPGVDAPNPYTQPEFDPEE